MFRVYDTTLFINGTRFTEVWIDPHYELKHSRSINDDLILKLVDLLDGKWHLPQVVRDDGFRFFATDLELGDKLYRLIWVIPPDESYIGVRNAYRSRR